MGEGPRLRILSVKSVHIWAHFGPIAAERLYISSREGSIFTSDNNFFACLTLFAA
jgi:microcystin degradation protein MlrC